MSKENDIWGVCIYETHLSYGGPEEGGWFYKEGVPDENGSYMKSFLSYEEALDYCDSLEEVCEILNQERGNIPLRSSLSKGWLEPFVTKGLPKPFPSIKPHYE